MICPFATWRPITANTGRPMADIRGFAAHSQVGYGDLYDVFNNPARQASTHFWISQKGDLEQYVDTDTQAWAHGPGNPYFWSSEFEGMSYNDGPQEMDGDPFTSAQIDKAGQLIAWLHGLVEFPVVINTDGLHGYGLTPHRTLMQTACPGMLRLGQYAELQAATLRWLDGNPAPTPPTPQPEEDEMVLDVLAMYAHVKQAPDHAGVEFWLGVYKAQGAQACWAQFMGAVASQGHPVP